MNRMQNLLNELQKIGFVETRDIDMETYQLYDVALINENMNAVVIYTAVQGGDILYKTSLCARKHH